MAVSKDKKGFLGFIGYKVGMASVVLKDNTEHSMTKGQKIITSATVLECPPMKILSVRFYKNSVPVKEVVAGGDKELKSKVKPGKKKGKLDLDFKDYDEIRVIAYSLVSKTSIKKSPDLTEIAIGGSKEEQLETAKSFLNKEIPIEEVFKEGLVDIRGVTKGKGLCGPVKRFGISHRFHKSEKGVKKVGSIGPWHPARVMFSVPMAGQLGFFSRINYNNKILESGKINEKNINPERGFEHYGKIRTEYLILKGSLQGPAKRPLLLIQPMRPTKKQAKKKFDFVGIAK
nr:large subunit ribosomal protein L3 [uncultured archaeon]